MKRDVFFISDGTGITAENFGKSLLTQFPAFKFKKSTFPFIDSLDKAQDIIQIIRTSQTNKQHAPLVFYTIVNSDIAPLFSESFKTSYPIFHNFIKPIEKALRFKSSHKIGRKHETATIIQYRKRSDAINYTLDKDDGIGIKDYNKADFNQNIPNIDSSNIYIEEISSQTTNQLNLSR